MNRLIPSLAAAILLAAITFEPAHSDDQEVISIEQLRTKVLEARESVRSGVLEIKTYINLPNNRVNMESEAWFDGPLIRVDRMGRLSAADQYITQQAGNPSRYVSRMILNEEELIDFSFRGSVDAILNPPFVKIAPLDRIKREEVVPIEPRHIGWRLGSQWLDDQLQTPIWPLSDGGEEIAMAPTIHKHQPGWEISYADARGLNVSVIVIPTWGYQVVKATAEGETEGSLYSEALEVTVEEDLGSNLWFPSKTVYRRKIDDEVTYRERNVIAFTQLNRKLPADHFELDALDLPESIPQRRMLDTGDYDPPRRGPTPRPAAAHAADNQMDPHMAIKRGATILTAISTFMSLIGYIVWRTSRPPSESVNAAEED